MENESTDQRRNEGVGGWGVRSERKDSITCLGCCITASLQPVFKNVRLCRFLLVAAVACSVVCGDLAK